MDLKDIEVHENVTGETILTPAQAGQGEPSSGPPQTPFIVRTIPDSNPARADLVDVNGMEDAFHRMLDRMEEKANLMDDQARELSPTLESLTLGVELEDLSRALHSLMDVASEDLETFIDHQVTHGVFSYKHPPHGTIHHMIPAEEWTVACACHEKHTPDRPWPIAPMFRKMEVGPYTLRTDPYGWTRHHHPGYTV